MDGTGGIRARRRGPVRWLLVLSVAGVGAALTSSCAIDDPYNDVASADASLDSAAGGGGGNVSGSGGASGTAGTDASPCSEGATCDSDGGPGGICRQGVCGGCEPGDPTSCSAYGAGYCCEQSTGRCRDCGAGGAGGSGGSASCPTGAKCSQPPVTNAGVCAGGQCQGCTAATPCGTLYGAGQACCNSGSCSPCDAGAGDSGSDGGGGPPSLPTLAAGAGTSCAIVSGMVYCWGSNSAGQLGTGASDGASHPTPQVGPIALSVAVGGNHVCVLASATTLRCWGSNSAGQLGSSGCTGTCPPTDVALPLTPWRIAAGGLDTCAIAGAAHQIYCWGSNAGGKLGVGPLIGTTDTPQNLPLLGGGAINLELGPMDTCAGDGMNTWCWGANADGELGLGPIGQQDTPAMLAEGGIVEMALGAAHACGRWQNGDVRCWGRNDRGQLGPSGTADPPTSTQPTVVTNARQIVAGMYFSCALLGSGDVTCWGANDVSQMGTGPPDASNHLPSRVGPAVFNSVQELAAGLRHVCARLPGDKLWCWGANESGQCGQSADPVHYPMEVPGF